METIENLQLDQERALYGKHDFIAKNVSFSGEADGESAVKECKNVVIANCYCNLRYPFWHDKNISIDQTEMTANCRAALWYTENAVITHTKMHGIKALRECKNVKISDCDIDSAEFGWSVKGIEMKDSTAVSEYFMMRSKNINFTDVKFKGKYSFQYIQNSTFQNCQFDTKDAFWHGKNVTVKNCLVKGEYLAWYSENLTLENCTVIGTQPFCYCKNLRLINCKMIDTDLCFEKSTVEADITTPIISVKNVYGGYVKAPKIQEIICDDRKAKGQIIVEKQ